MDAEKWFNDSRWLSMGVDDDGALYYLDTKSIQKEGDSQKLEVRAIPLQNSNQPDIPEGTSYIYQQWKVYPKRRTFDLLSFRYYDTQDQLLSSIPFQQLSEIDIKAGSVAEKIKAAVCKSEKVERAMPSLTGTTFFEDRINIIFLVLCLVDFLLNIYCFHNEGNYRMPIAVKIGSFCGTAVIPLIFCVLYNTRKDLIRKRTSRRYFVGSMIVCGLLLFGTFYGEKSNKREAEEWYSKGTVFLDSEQYGTALDAFSKSIKLNPNNATAYFHRGIAYDIGFRNYQQATKDYDRAIELDPKDAEAYYNRGIVHTKLGNYSQAVRDYNRTIEFNPDNTYAYWGRAIAHGNLGNKDQAIKDMQMSARLGDKGAQEFLSEQQINW